jgi:hypothetical protein
MNFEYFASYSIKSNTFHIQLISKDDINGTSDVLEIPK